MPSVTVPLAFAGAVGGLALLEQSASLWAVAMPDRKVGCTKLPTR